MVGQWREKKGGTGGSSEGIAGRRQERTVEMVEIAMNQGHKNRRNSN